MEQKDINRKLDEFNRYLIGKKVAIIGLGVSNLPLIDYLYNLRCEITLFDNKELKDLSEEVREKVIEHNFEFSFGVNSLDRLKGFDIIFRSPSCLPSRKELVEEAKRGAIVTTEIEMVIELAPCMVIGVTGSDGKTTTTTLISEILKEEGYNVFLGGNIGIPLFTRIAEMKRDDVVVLELSSFQLMNMKISPNVAVITNITPNHLDIHKDFEEYIDAKKTIFKYQTEKDKLILNYDNDITRSFAKEAKGKVEFFASKTKIKNGLLVDNGKIKECKSGLRYHLFDTEDMIIKGNHNYEDACAAILATRDLVKKESIDKVLNTFRGVEHRIEFVKVSKDNVKWYNDSVSSSPTRTIAGLNAFTRRNIILIAGGYDKNLDYAPIGKPIVDNCKAVILLGQTAGKIEKAINDNLKSSRKLEIYKCNSLEETVLKANEIAGKDDIVLFSPASASFDMFKNFAERGIKFKELVRKYIK